MIECFAPCTIVRMIVHRYDSREWKCFSHHPLSRCIIKRINLREFKWSNAEPDQHLPVFLVNLFHEIGMTSMRPIDLKPTNDHSDTHEPLTSFFFFTTICDNTHPTSALVNQISPISIAGHPSAGIDSFPCEPPST